MSSFSCENLTIEVANVTAVKGLKLELNHGCYVIMGPNGSGKSSFAGAVAGRSAYKVSAGNLFVNSQAINDLDSYQRAKLGIFVTYQEPIELLGVTFNQMYLAADPPVSEKQLSYAAELLEIDYEAFKDKVVNKDLSGGEKKRAELLNLMALDPKVAILDEIDSGLDVDGLDLIKRAIKMLFEINPKRVVVSITHYPKLAKELSPEKVFILKDGTIKASGGIDLIDEVSLKGYEAF
jgi:Fe-S cluster assembly ATP-binding protein